MGSMKFIAPSAMALLVVACGGGGGGGGDNGGGGTEPTSATVSLTGVAAKGLMANADVGVFAVNADGTVATTALATATTDTAGKYALTFTGTQGQPYVVEVSAKVDGSTSEADEVSGTTVALPAGFAMRALLIPATTGAIATSVNVTPFSEMAAAAAAKASGGITAANAAQAMATVKQLVGFDPTVTDVVSTSAAGATADEQKLAVLLTAVSQMANSGALGCAGTGVGQQTRCVVDALGAAASTTTLKLTGAGNTDVSTALNTAINQVLTSDLAGNVNAATLTAVVANLGCSTNCAVAGTTPSNDALASGIAAAKLLFGQMKADWMNMFSGDGITSVSQGAANAQAFKFSQAVGDMRQPFNTMLQDTVTLLTGVDLYNQYTAGTRTSNTETDGIGNVPSNDPRAFAGLGTTGCALYTDDTTSVLASAPADAKVIGCSSYYYAERSTIPGGIRNAIYRHGMLITPNPDGSFGWQMRARRTVNDCTPTCVRTANDSLQFDVSGQPRSFTGTLAQALTQGQVTTWALGGDFPAGFVSRGSTLADDHSTITLNVARTIDAASGDTTDASISAGSFISKDSSGAALATLSVKHGHIGSIAVGFDRGGNVVAPDSPNKVSSGYILGPFEFDLTYATPGASIEGVVSASDLVWDKSKTSTIPTKESFSGTLTTIDPVSGARTDFLTGTLSGSATGFASFDATQPLSASNTFTQALTFVGTVTAPNRPVLEVTLSGSAQPTDSGFLPLPATLQYRALVNGQPRTVVNFTASPASATNPDLTRFSFSEAASGLTAAWQDTDTQVKLMKDTLEIGTLDLGTRVITFKDGSVMSLDIAL
jgi:hypothetical protein